MSSESLQSELITPSEAAKRLHMGTVNFYQGLRQGAFPFGVAIETDDGNWIYKIPRAAFERFMDGSFIEGAYPSEKKEYNDLITPEEVSQRLKMTLEEVYEAIRLEILPFGFCYGRIRQGRKSQTIYRIPRRAFDRFTDGDEEYITLFRQFVNFILTQQKTVI